LRERTSSIPEPLEPLDWVWSRQKTFAH